MIRPVLAAAIIGCTGIGAIGVTLAEAGRITYIDGAYAIAENLLVIAACLTLALAVWPRSTHAGTAPVPPAAYSPRESAPLRRPGRLLAGIILMAIGCTAALRAIAPGSSLLIALMPISVFVLPGLAWVQCCFSDLPLLWRAIVTPALSSALLLIAIAWMVWIGVALTPVTVIAAATLFSLTALVAPLVAPRLIRPTDRPHPETAE